MIASPRNMFLRASMGYPIMFTLLQFLFYVKFSACVQFRLFSGVIHSSSPHQEIFGHLKVPYLVRQGCVGLIQSYVTLFPTFNYIFNVSIYPQAVFLCHLQLIKCFLPTATMTLSYTFTNTSTLNSLISIHSFTSHLMQNLSQSNICLPAASQCFGQFAPHLVLLWPLLTIWSVKKNKKKNRSFSGTCFRPFLHLLSYVLLYLFLYYAHAGFWRCFQFTRCLLMAPQITTFRKAMHIFLVTCFRLLLYFLSNIESFHVYIISRSFLELLSALWHIQSPFGLSEFYMYSVFFVVPLSYTSL